MKNNNFIKDILDNKKYSKNYLNNLDNYVTFIKNKLTLDESELKYIIKLTIENQKIINDFEYLFMKKYLKNYNILKEYININKLNFDDLIKKLNQLKNKAHFYFEDIDKNLPYYIPILDYLENTSNILL